MSTSSAATRTTRRTLLAGARLYLCTDSRTSRGDLREFPRACHEGDTDIIQLRNKRINTRNEVAAVETLAEVAAEHGKLFAVNDHANIAALTGVDILHVDQEDLITEQIRQIVGPEVLIGRSGRNLNMFTAPLTDDGINYAVIGPVYATPTGSDRQPVGVDMVRGAAALVQRVRAQGSAGSHQDSIADIVRLHDCSASDPVKPWQAIGDINAETTDEVIGAGAKRTIVARAPTETVNPEEATRAPCATVTGADGIDSRGDEQ